MGATAYLAILLLFLLFGLDVVVGHVAALAKSFGIVAGIFVLTVPGALCASTAQVATLAHQLGVVRPIFMLAAEDLASRLLILPADTLLVGLVLILDVVLILFNRDNGTVCQELSFLGIILAHAVFIFDNRS